jgi:hypothetical protein
MNITNKIILITALLNCFCLSFLNAQEVFYLEEQIIGKWVLKSAIYNREALTLVNEPNWISFEFVKDGEVILKYADGRVETGKFLINDNKLIDPNAPECLNADIISLSKEGLILAMEEDKNRVVMTFELEVVE